MDYSLETSSSRQSRKMCLAPDNALSKYSDERPKGKMQGMFSSNSTSSISFSQNGLLSTKPMKKHFHCAGAMNPILQGSEIRTGGGGKKILQSSPSVLAVYSSQRKFNLPSELGIGNRYEQHYQSKVFTESSTSYLFNGKNKKILAKEGEITNLLKYEYALPYKEQSLTSKIGYI